MRSYIVNKSGNEALGYTITVRTTGKRCELPTSNLEKLLIWCSVLLIGVPWLLVYELYSIAHKDQVLNRDRHITVSKDKFDHYTIGQAIENI